MLPPRAIDVRVEAVDIHDNTCGLRVVVRGGPDMDGAVLGLEPLMRCFCRLSVGLGAVEATPRNDADLNCEAAAHTIEDGTSADVFIQISSGCNRP